MMTADLSFESDRTCHLWKFSFTGRNFFLKSSTHQKTQLENLHAIHQLSSTVRPQSPWATKTEMKTIIQIFQISLLATILLYVLLHSQHRI